MSLKRRLSRLPGGPRGSEQKGIASSKACRPSASSLDTPLATSSLDALEATRRQLEQALGEAASGPEPSEQSQLPFERYETPRGAVARRTVAQQLPPQVGRISVERAFQADARVLSLLSLDPSLAGVDLRRVVFFDTETTGFAGAGTLAFLVGLGWFDERGGLVLEQLLLEGPEQEMALLWRLDQLFDWASAVVSFNGKSFDWPLLTGRCVMNRLAELPRRPHIDLLHVSRRIHKARLRRFQLKTLEVEVLGFWRPDDDVSGSEIPPRFGHFLRSGDPTGILPVIFHNEWDVMSLVALLGVYGEPLEYLICSDLLGVAKTYQRSRAIDRALSVVEHVMTTGASREALELRAKLLKSQGDRARALRDFEQLASEVKEPEVALELAKLYEHYARDYGKALEALAEGTAEDAAQQSRRRERLLRKLYRE